MKDESLFRYLLEERHSDEGWNIKHDFNGLKFMIKWKSKYYEDSRSPYARSEVRVPKPEGVTLEEVAEIVSLI